MNFPPFTTIVRLKKILIAALLSNVIALQAQTTVHEHDTTKIRRLIDQSKAIMDSQPDSSLFLLNNAVDLAQALNNDFWIGRCYNSLGVVYFTKGDYTRALSNYYDALAYHKKINYPLGICQANLNIGIIFSKTGYYEKATERLVEARKYAEKNQFSLLSAILNSLGVLARQQGNYDEAIGYYTKSIMVSRQHHTVREMAGTYGNIANLYLIAHQPDSAIFFNLKALHLFDSIQNKRGQAVCYNNLADCFRTKHDFPRSLEFSSRAADVSREGGFRSHFFTAQKGFAEVYMELGEYTKALYYLKQIVDDGRDYDRHQLLACLQLAAKCYHSIDKHNEAYKLLSRAVTLKDSLVNEDMLMAVNKTKAAYELEKKETQIQKLLGENFARREQLLQVIVSGILFIIVIVLAVLYFHLVMKKKKEVAEMTALRLQMNPHFIFNCLNSINNYIVKSAPETASHYLTRFSKLIRLILENSRNPSVSLESELTALRLYIEMELMRFDNRFTYSIDIAPGVNVVNLEIPPLILQPYVENAIWHGLMKKKQNGHLSITVSVDNDLRLMVEDNGVGRKKSIDEDAAVPQKKSLGMNITLERIRQFSIKRSKAASVIVEDLESNGVPAGTRVTIVIPLR